MKNKSESVRTQRTQGGLSLRSYSLASLQPLRTGPVEDSRSEHVPNAEETGRVAYPEPKTFSRSSKSDVELFELGTDDSWGERRDVSLYLPIVSEKVLTELRDVVDQPIRVHSGLDESSPLGEGGSRVEEEVDHQHVVELES